MDSTRLQRRMIALTVAYAVALQALLSAFAPLAPASLSDPLAVLCAHDRTDGTGQPAGHDWPCAAICAAISHGIAGPLPPDLVVAMAAPKVVLALAAGSDWVPPHLSVRRPQVPRAPPRA
jgi:hypothetical protein